MFRSYQARVNAAQRQLREEFAGDVIREFGPIVAAFGFTQSGWSHDKDLDMIQVYFKDPQRDHAVQIDCDTHHDTFTANYCRQDAEWEICSEGKPKSFIGLKKTVARWLQNNCEQCCIDCPIREEAQQSVIALSIDTLNPPVPTAKPTMSPDAIPRCLGRSCCAITMVTVNVEISPTIMW